MIKSCINLISVLLLTVAVASCRPAPKTTTTSGMMTVMCDNSFENIMQQEIDVYEFQYPDAYIIPYYIPQQEAIDSLLELKTNTIVIARDLTNREKNQLKKKNQQVKSQMIAVDALALIVNPDNPIEELSVGELSDILAGKLKNWEDLSPSDLGEISVVFDNNGSSLMQYMRDSLLHGLAFGKNVYVQGSIDGVFDAVKSNKNAIGVIGVSWITSDMRSKGMSAEELHELSQDMNAQMDDYNYSEDIKVLAVTPDDQYRPRKPYQSYIYSGEYPLFRQIYMVTTGAGGGVDNGFFSFVTGVNGQRLIMRTGVLPAVIYPKVIELTREN